MKAITIHQPFARAIVAGDKKIETRSWRTPYRGPLAIHAASKFSGEDRRTEIKLVLEGCISASIPNQLAGIIGTVELLDIVPIETVIPKLSRCEKLLGDYEKFSWAWILAAPKARIFRPWKGEQGRIFEVKL